MDRRIAAALLLLALATQARAASELKRSEDFAGDCRLTVTTLPKPVLLSSGSAVMSCAWTADEVSGRNEVCFVNENRYSTNTVRVSTFSPDSGDFASYGWPIRGTEKECHDWGSRINVWIWRDSNNPDQSVTIRVSR